MQNGRLSGFMVTDLVNDQYYGDMRASIGTNPSGRMLIICLPIIREALCKILAGRTLFSDIDISLSKTVLVRKSNQPSIGSYQYN
jgi:hypothetical protein